MFKTLSRVLLHFKPLDDPEEPSPYAKKQHDVEVETLDEANLISSKIKDSDLHAPVIDFDIPIAVLPSSQEGHYHLYIQQPTSWAKYEAILNSLAVAGYVEPKYVSVSVHKGYSSVRKPGTFKFNLDDQETAELRTEIARLMMEKILLEEELHDARMLNIELQQEQASNAVQLTWD